MNIANSSEWPPPNHSMDNRITLGSTTPTGAECLPSTPVHSIIWFIWFVREVKLITCVRKTPWKFKTALLFFGGPLVYRKLIDGFQSWFTLIYQLAIGLVRSLALLTANKAGLKNSSSDLPKPADTWAQHWHSGTLAHWHCPNLAPDDEAVADDHRPRETDRSENLAAADGNLASASSVGDEKNLVPGLLVHHKSQRTQLPSPL